MADEIKKVVIIQVDLDIAGYKKEMQGLNGEVAKLTAENKKLEKSSPKFTENQLALANYSKQIGDLKRVINNATVANAEHTGSNEQLKAALSASTYELNKMGEEEKATTAKGIALRDQVSGLSEALKKNESEVGNNTRNVGNYGSALRDLRAEFKAAKGEMIAIAAASGMDSKEFQAAAAKAGLLKDKMDDINVAAKSMASGSGLGQFKNQLGSVGQSLKELDFKEAAERAKGLKTIAQTISFKDTIAGAKAFATSIYEVGVAMMALPIFWVVAGIAAITGAIVLWTKTTQESAQKQVDGLQRIQDRYTALYEGQIRLAKAAGKETEQLELDKMEVIRRSQDYQLSVLKKLQESHVGLNDEQKKLLDDLKKKQIQNIFDISEIRIAGYKKQSDASKAALEKDLELIKKFNETKKAQDDKAAEEARKLDEQRIADNLRLLHEIQDQKIAAIKDDEQRELSKQALDNARALEAITKSKADNDTKYKAIEAQQEDHERKIFEIQDKYAAKRHADFDKAVADQIKSDEPRIKAAQAAEDEIGKAQEERISNSLDASLAAMKKEEEESKKHADALKRLEEKSLSDTSSAINSIFAIQTNGRNAELSADQQETNEKIDNLQRQADAGIITQDEFTTKSNRIKTDERKREAEIKKKQFEADKKLALIQVAIKTAQGVMTAFNAATPYEVAAYAAAALVTGGLEAAVIESQQPPAFAKGGKTALSGKKINSTDGLRINRSNGDNLLATVRANEVILNERQQAMLGGANTFRAIGVPGFAGGGITDGGTLATRLTSNIDAQVALMNQQAQLNRLLPAPVIGIQDIVDAANNNAVVLARGDIS